MMRGLVLVLCLAAGAASAAPIFGASVNIRQTVGTGDFDGDGKADTLYLVSTAPGAPAGDVTAIGSLFGSPAHGPQKTALAIAMGNGRKFLVEDGDFFTTPIWSAAKPPLGIARRGTFKGFRQRGDVVVLGTEAGIDTALYWDGKSFALFQPNQEP